MVLYICMWYGVMMHYIILTVITTLTILLLRNYYCMYIRQYTFLVSISQNVVSVISVVKYDVIISLPLKFLHLRSILDLRFFVKTAACR